MNPPAAASAFVFMAWYVCVGALLMLQLVVRTGIVQVWFYITQSMELPKLWDVSSEHIPKSLAVERAQTG